MVVLVSHDVFMYGMYLGQVNVPLVFVCFVFVFNILFFLCIKKKSI